MQCFGYLHYFAPATPALFRFFETCIVQARLQGSILRFFGYFFFFPLTPFLGTIHVHFDSRALSGIIIHCDIHCNIHCNIHCDIQCNIHCNIHCKIHCNIHCNVAVYYLSLFTFVHNFIVGLYFHPFAHFCTFCTFSTILYIFAY